MLDIIITFLIGYSIKREMHNRNYKKYIIYIQVPEKFVSLYYCIEMKYNIKNIRYNIFHFSENGEYYSPFIKII